MSHHGRTLAAAAALLLLLTACGGDDGGSGGSGAPAAPEGTAAATPAPGTPPATPGPTATPGGSETEDLTVPPAAGRGTTVTGTVEAGVEPGCLLLAPEGGGEAYLLLGGPARDVSPGARVRAVGTVETDLLSTCQQGTPFQVTELELLP
ncbi:hypothetical protein [Vallicoccus soli]|uniref:Lipoprotein n=1 Tax=Vallicoccus soli TaxID=2339232 RepID=A0A3A3YZT4_9ACTN|nr:hypothetical protein [Vallicoccus soli]RJK96393.1 hypothetical protein D5H78_09175 [Vallicoccus soli]